MSAKIELRDIEASDLALFFEHQHDQVAVEMVAFDSRERAEFDEQWAKLLADEAIMKKTVLVDGEVAGHLVSFPWEGKREIGYWIDRAFWGRGVATAAVAGFLCLDQTRPLFASVAKHNTASIRVLQKCGFVLLDSADQPPAGAEASQVCLRLT